MAVFFHENGFERSGNEPTIYLKKEGKIDFLFICLYVDYMLYFGSNEHLLANFKSTMMKKFEMTNLELLQYFLGLEVQQIVDGILISPQKYVIDMLNMLKGNTTSTLMKVNEKLQVKDGTKGDTTYFGKVNWWQTKLKKWNKFMLSSSIFIGCITTIS